MKLFEPKIKFSKLFSWEDEEPSKPYQADVVIAIEDYYFEELEKYTDDMIPLLLPITNYLKQAMELFQLLGQSDDKYDLSNVYLPSISPHHQNNRYHNWTLLIELCRDLWQAAYQNDKNLALAIVELWKTIPFPVFKRLIFHAYANSDITTPSEKLNYLLLDNHHWLWSGAVDREKFRLLASLLPQLNVSDLIGLEQAIIAGVPRETYRSDLSDEEYKRHNDREIWLHLAKLESFNITLTEQAKSIYSELSKQYQYWKLDEGERDEFGVWMSGLRSGYDCDLTIDDLIQLPIEQRIEKLSEEGSYPSGRLELFKNSCKENLEFVLETLSYLVTQSNWNHSIWHSALLGLSDIDNPTWMEIAKLLVQAPVSFFEQEAWVIVWWAEKAIKNVIAESEEENYFWTLFNLVVNNVKQAEEIKNDIINQAINNPIGRITEALINRFSIRKIETNATITDVTLLACLEKLLHNKRDDFVLARAILVSRLHYFYAIDSEWTKTTLIPLLDWDSSSEASFLWQAYLWNARVPRELALVLKENFSITLLKHADKLGKFTIAFLSLSDKIILLKYKKVLLWNY